MTLRGWLLLLLFCGSASAAPPLVSVEWLHKQIGRDALVLVDTRPAPAYRQGHIPGAVSFPSENAFDAGDRDGLVPSTQQVARQLGQLGIDESSTVVLYDSGDLSAAPRVFWVLEVLAHTDVHVLDGGLGAWRQWGSALTTQVPSVATRTYVPGVDRTRLASRSDIEMALHDPSVALIDSREPRFFSGREPSGDRAGHIPTAINIPASGNLGVDEHGVPTFKPAQAIAQRYQAVGGADKVVAYCDRGGEAALNYLALRQLGRNVAVYDGSWQEWSRDRNLPINPGPGAGR